MYAKLCRSKGLKMNVLFLRIFWRNCYCDFTCRHFMTLITIGVVRYGEYLVFLVVLVLIFYSHIWFLANVYIAIASSIDHLIFTFPSKAIASHKRYFIRITVLLSYKTRSCISKFLAQFSWKQVNNPIKMLLKYLSLLLYAHDIIQALL